MSSDDHDFVVAFMRDHATHDDLEEQARDLYEAFGSAYLRTSGEVEVFVEAPTSEFTDGVQLRVRASNDTREVLLHFDAAHQLRNVEIVARGEGSSR
jgi:uncharacterized protein (DUF1330 family)